MVNKLYLKYKHFVCLEFDLTSLQVNLLMIYEFVIVNYSFQSSTHIRVLYKM